MKMKNFGLSENINEIDLGRYSEALGEDLPTFPPNRIGQFRVKQLLRRKFGAGWRNHKQAQDILNYFDGQLKIRGM